MTRPPGSYELTFEERSGYLYARLTAETATEETSWKYLREITDRCSEIKCTRILFHRDIPETLQDGMQLYMALNFQNMTTGVKTAVVNPYVSNTDTLSFAAEASRKHGADVALFTNDADAEEWLLAD